MLPQLISSSRKYTQRLELIERKKTDGLVSTLRRWWTTNTRCFQRVIWACVSFFSERLHCGEKSSLCSHHWAQEYTVAIFGVVVVEGDCLFIHAWCPVSFQLHEIYFVSRSVVSHHLETVVGRADETKTEKSVAHSSTPHTSWQTSVWLFRGKKRRQRAFQSGCMNHCRWSPALWVVNVCILPLEEAWLSISGVYSLL